MYALINAGPALVKIGGAQDPAVKATLQLPRAEKGSACMALHTTTTPASVWASLCRWKGVEFVRRLEEKDGAFVQAAEVCVGGTPGWEDWHPWTPSPYIVADPYREELYLRNAGMCGPNDCFRVDGRTGRVIDQLKFNLKDQFEEAHVGSDQMVHLRLCYDGRWIARYDPDAHEFLAFPGATPVAAVDWQCKPIGSSLDVFYAGFRRLRAG
jgi:hypothetical protein